MLRHSTWLQKVVSHVYVYEKEYEFNSHADMTPVARPPIGKAHNVDLMVSVYERNNGRLF
jgi:hypothetical protein